MSLALVKIGDPHQSNAAQDDARVQDCGCGFIGISVDLDPINGVQDALHGGGGGCHARAPSL